MNLDKWNTMKEQKCDPLTTNQPRKTSISFTQYTWFSKKSQLIYMEIAKHGTSMKFSNNSVEEKQSYENLSFKIRSNWCKYRDVTGLSETDCRSANIWGDLVMKVNIISAEETKEKHKVELLKSAL